MIDPLLFSMILQIGKICLILICILILSIICSMLFKRFMTDDYSDKAPFITVNLNSHNYYNRNKKEGDDNA